MRFTSQIRRKLTGCGSVLIVAMATAGCSTIAEPPEPTPVRPVSFPLAEPDPDFIPVLRQGRYTLVELAPASAQHDLMRQVVQVSLPAGRRSTVGDALRQILSRSGYKLCSADDSATLSALPLPASHHRLGPLMLRDALLTLSGAAWNLQVDDRTRTVCFSRAPYPAFAAGEMKPDFDTTRVAAVNTRAAAGKAKP
ncbi:PilL N-terminal domain-containing protein [Shinella sp.]|uniref:PFGI-1 class ICE element type IV pilus protein PilL2 n=1 Tax=Shinella sp. TaxID=1870904 RepID=UPI00258C0A70|nr:PilL N-terminal domain-containing protein [Shinella sp.]MCW5712325.1 PilL N-terminal domain-containing protein [Shinella sp.]